MRIKKRELKAMSDRIARLSAVANGLIENPPVKLHFNEELKRCDLCGAEESYVYLPAATEVSNNSIRIVTPPHHTPTCPYWLALLAMRSDEG
jgi:hypothetical protein